MNKLIKEINFGEYEFKIGINRDIALKVAEQFPDILSEMLDKSKDVKDFKTAIKQGKLRDLLESSDLVSDNIAEMVKFALPLMLKEAGADIDAETLIVYAIENDADQIFNMGIWEVLMLGFTSNGAVKTPKIKFTMK